MRHAAQGQDNESSLMPTNAIRGDHPRTLTARIRILSAALLCLFALGIRAAPADDGPADTAHTAPREGAAADAPTSNGAAAHRPAAPKAASQGTANELPARVETRHSVRTDAG